MNLHVVIICLIRVFLKKNNQKSEYKQKKNKLPGYVNDYLTVITLMLEFIALSVQVLGHRYSTLIPLNKMISAYRHGKNTDTHSSLYCQ